MNYFIGIDLGGTNIAVGVVDQEYRLVAKTSVKTQAPRPCADIAADMEQAVRAVVQEAGIRLQDAGYIGIGSPGIIDVAKGEVIFASNLSFHNEPLARYVEERLGIPALLYNDADAAAYGEFIAGAGRGTTSMVAVTLGTGVGSGIILDSKIHSGFAYAGGELGHTTLVYNGHPCSCGRRGCLDVYASATGLIRITCEQMRRMPESRMWELAGGSLDQVSGRTAFEAMRLGDPGGIQVVEEFTGYLAEGVANVSNMLQPEVICIGGGISKEGEYLLRPVRAYLERCAFSRFAERQSRLQIAELGNDAGIIGAALIGLQHHGAPLPLDKQP